MNNCISVSQLNTYIKSVIDFDPKLNKLFVVGEISNLNIHYKSGHIYLSLKDNKSVIKAVMFASSAKRLKFKPCDGMKIIARGRVSVYDVGGQYQLYIEDMQPDGLGALNLAYEQLWEKLSKEGLFDEFHKKTLPRYPEKIAVITSPTGAAVRDVFSILERRWGLSKVKLYPCTVQGEKAVPELLSALQKADSDNVDLIIIGRGGGSLEDLWAFNDEELARAIYEAKTPVISAVGHENDYTICDYVADLRASTPSAAAELAVPFVDEEKEKILKIYASIRYLIDAKINNYSIALDRCSRLSESFNLFIEKKQDKHKILSKNIEIYNRHKIENCEHLLSKQISVLDSLSPLKVLKRGYAVLSIDEKTLKNVSDIGQDDVIKARLQDGQADLVLKKENV
ncbi:MAG: exodeoxyribonuclease VII large subunit [Clostridia bacterium]